MDAALMVVDDDPFVRDVLVRWLRDEGYKCRMAACATSAWEQLNQRPADALMLDIRMPGGSGLDLLDQIKQRFPDTAVLMVSGEADSQKAIRALTHGACGYLVKPVNRQELLAQLLIGLEHRRLVIDNRGYLRDLEQKVRDQTAAIRGAHEETIHRLVKASLCRDNETGAHIRRTGWFSELLASMAGWNADRAEQIRLAAPMHDVGKIGIPDAILCKPGNLTSNEFAVMQSHTVLGAKMLAGSQWPVLRMAEEIARYHHERWDGQGYPAGLVGEQIPKSARIVAIVDCYDALTHDRVYRRALPEKDVLRLMAEGRGTHFDPRLLDIFMSILPEIRAVAEIVPDDAEDGIMQSFSNGMATALDLQDDSQHVAEFARPSAEFF